MTIVGLPFASNLKDASVQVVHGLVDGLPTDWIDVCNALSFRLLGSIVGKDAGSTGTCVIKLYGRLRGVEFLISTLNIVANGVSIVKNTNLSDVRGYEEVQARLSYTNAPNDYVTLTLVGSTPLE